MIDDYQHDLHDHHDYFHTWSVRLSRSCLSTGTIKATSAPVQWESYNHDDQDHHHDDDDADHDGDDDEDVNDFDHHDGGIDDDDASSIVIFMIL